MARAGEERPFSYTGALQLLARDIAATLPELAHVDTDRVLFGVRSARSDSRHGQHACCVPLRCEGGARETFRGGRRWRLPVVRCGGVEMLYAVFVMLPRFHTAHEYPERLAVLIHELYHISPEFNGDLRRFAGRNYAHGGSREAYHREMRRLAARYQALRGTAAPDGFLRVPFAELLARPGGVTATTLRLPSLQPVLEEPPGKRPRQLPR